MDNAILIERLFEALVAGDRPVARSIIQETIDEGAPAEALLTDLFWPVYERVETLHRNDQLTSLAHHLATRLLRVLVDQASVRLERQALDSRRVFAVCGPTDADELGAQMAVDIIESKGFTVTFAAGGIAADEILSHVQESRPDVLLLFASSPSDLPSIRWLIDTIQEIGACRNTQVVVGGGVFNRADGLAEEIGADLWASDPLELADAMLDRPERRAPSEQRTVGRNKNRRRSAAA